MNKDELPELPSSLLAAIQAYAQTYFDYSRGRIQLAERGASYEGLLDQIREYAQGYGALPIAQEAQPVDECPLLAAVDKFITEFNEAWNGSLSNAKVLKDCCRAVTKLEKARAALQRKEIK